MIRLFTQLLFALLVMSSDLPAQSKTATPTPQASVSIPADKTESNAGDANADSARTAAPQKSRPRIVVQPQLNQRNAIAVTMFAVITGLTIAIVYGLRNRKKRN